MTQDLQAKPNASCTHYRELIEGFVWTCLDCGLKMKLKSISYDFEEEPLK